MEKKTKTFTVREKMIALENKLGINREEMIDNL